MSLVLDADATKFRDTLEKITGGILKDLAISFERKLRREEA